MPILFGISKKWLAAKSHLWNMPESTCDAYLESVREQCYTMPIEGVRWVQRALDLSLSISDTARTEKIVQFMFEFHDRISERVNVPLV
jgi:hypothetical protein